MLLIEIAIVIVLAIVNGVLAMSELAIVSARPARLRMMAERGVKGANRAIALQGDPGRFLSTVQIGITLVGVIAGAFSGATLGARFSVWLLAHGVPESFADPVAYGSVVTFITYLSLVIGELAPKQLALRNAEAIACAMSPAMTMLARIAKPLVTLLDLSGDVVLALIGRRDTPQSKVTEDEVKSIVAEAESAGVIEPEERAMIARIMRLGDRPVRAVMTPRREVDHVDFTAPSDAIRSRLAGSIHSRLPACNGSLDDITGIVQAKDLLNAFLSGSEIDWHAFVRSAPVIPDTMDVLDVVKVLKESAVHIGLVYDEYGHFAGVVTSADILEAIVGEFRTEEGPPEPYAVRRQDGSFLISGAMPVDEMAELIGVGLPAERDYHTVAGLLLSEFGSLPQVAESTVAFGWRFEVLDLDGRRIDKVLVSRVSGGRRLAR